jgi:hypothetical protein
MDSDVLLSTIKMERKAALAPPQLPSSFAADVAAITGAALPPAPLSPGGSSVWVTFV